MTPLAWVVTFLVAIVLGVLAFLFWSLVRIGKPFDTEEEDRVLNELAANARPRVLDCKDMLGQCFVHDMHCVYPRCIHYRTLQDL